MNSIRIVARKNAVGVDRDVRILTRALAVSPTPPVFSHHREIGPLRRFLGRRDDDLAILFLERVAARWLRSAGQYLLIPNQERFPERLVPLLRHIDHILTKSRHAHEIFSRLHPSVHYIGFTSLDRRRDTITPDYTRFLHLAGGSALKGTDTLIDVWARHPEWPTLTMLHHRRDTTYTVPPNVHVLRHYLPDNELIELQNTCGIHLCPSLSEGWGHYIAEAMSCAAVVVTTDGPPMNEIVTSERGILVPYAHSERRKLGTNYHIDPDRLEDAIHRVLGETVHTKTEIGRRAREWYTENDRLFFSRIAEMISGFH